MSTHKHINIICVVVILFAVLLTVLCMNAEKLGVRSIIDEDSDGADNVSVTANDRNGDWDTSGATVIRLEGNGGTVSGDGAYFLKNVLYITKDGKYCISGTLEGTITVEAPKKAKVYISLEGVTVNGGDDAAFKILKADKVFLTLAKDSENTFTSDAAYSTAAQEEGVDGTVYAKEDLTINGAGSLTVEGQYKYGIEAKDDLVITGGTLYVSAKDDAIHVKNKFKYEEASLTVDAGDDAIHADDEITVSSGVILLQSCYEGLEAENIEISGGDITIYATDDGINACSADGSNSGFGNFGGFGNFNGNNSKGNKPDGNKSRGGSEEQQPSDAQTEENKRIDISTKEGSSQWPGGDFDENMPNPGDFDGSFGGNFGGFGGSFGDGEMPQMPDGGFGGNFDGNMPNPGDFDGSFDGNFGDFDGNFDGNFGDFDGNFGDFGGFKEQDGNSAANDSESESNGLPRVLISGGTIRILNAKGGDVDGIDSNGDIIITGGNVFVCVAGTGSNCALDYGSESGGKCVIDGGTVIATGGSAMLESISNESAQASVTYVASGTVSAGQSIVVTGASGEKILDTEIPYSFSAIIFSSPLLKTGDTITVRIGSTEESVALESVVTTVGSTSGGFGNFGGFGGGKR